MRIVGDVDCNTCEYLASCLCSRCYHSHDLKDYYEEASKDYYEIEDALCDQFIELQKTQEFTEVFCKAKSILEDCPYPKYLTIFAEDKSILACDGYMLCQLFCDVPEPLRGTKLVKLVNDGVFISKNSQSLWDTNMECVLSLLRPKPEQQRPYNASEIKKEDEDAIFSFVDLDGKPLLLRMRTKYLENAVDILGEELLIGIGSRPDHFIPNYFIFENSKGRIIICPKSKA
jgi:hypothetical protein